MEKTRKIKMISLCALLVAVLGLTIAFASLSQTLIINGSAAVDTATWDIHFENLTLSEKTGTAEVSGTPSLTGTVISGIDVSLNKPGDKIVYEFDLVNNGSIEAKLTNINVNNLISESSYVQKIYDCIGKTTFECINKYDFNKDGGITVADTIALYGSFDISLYDGDTRVAEYNKNRKTGKESGLWLEAHETKRLRLVIAFKDTSSFVVDEKVAIFDPSKPAVTLTFEQK